MTVDRGEGGGYSADEMARLREGFACTSGRTGAQEHPSPERIHDAVSGALPPAEVRALVEHIAACADCAEDWRIARELEAEAEEDAVSPAVFERREAAAHPAAPGRPRWAGLTRWGAVAAAAVVALLAAAVWLTPDRWPLGVDEPPVYRQAEDAEAIRSLVPAEEPLPRDEAVLAWAGGPEGSTFDLLVSTEELEPVAEASGLEEPRYRIPPEDLADLPPGAEILWRVEAVGPDGRRVRSPTFVVPIE